MQPESTPFSRWFLLFLILATCTPGLLFAGSGPAVTQPHVVARLITDRATIGPGETFRVGIHYKLEDHWHIYWKNPGDTGLSTEITWEFPEGFEVGPLEWPTPVRFEMFELMNYVHENDVVLFAQVTAPANLPANQTLTFRARTDWLVCEKVCVPGGASLEMSLPTASAGTSAEPVIAALFDGAEALLPQGATDRYTLRGYFDANTVYLLLIAQNGAALPPLDALYFFEDNSALLDDEGFSLSPAIDSNAPQRVTAIHETAVLLKLKKSNYAPAAMVTISGVFAGHDAWGGNAGSGLAISGPIQSGRPGDWPATTSKGGTPAGSLWGSVALGFLGGLILNLMPCVFPVLGLKIMSFVNQAGQDKRKVALHGLIFAAGVLVSMWLLAGTLIALRAGGQELGWGFQLQNPSIVFILAAVLLLFGLNMSGVFEIGSSAMGIGQNLTHRSGASGSFFSGVLATVVATPCSAPFLAPAIGAVLILPAIQSLTVFTAIGLGLAAPYLILSFAPRMVQLLPRPGAWMETLKQSMAFLLYASAGFLIWVQADQILTGTQFDKLQLLYAIFGLVLIAIGAWIYGRWATPVARKKQRRIATVAALLCIAGGIYAGMPKPSLLTWMDWEPGLAEQLAEEGKTVYVDFTASWCFTCQVNKRVVFGNNRVIRSFIDQEIVLLKADWTHNDERITRALAAYNRSAVPFNLVYGPALDEPTILPELLTPDTVLNAVRQARGL